VPQGLWLHQYANLYFHARNPMLYKRLGEARTLCVLRVSLDALAIPHTVITDSNAASDYVRFLHPSQWKLIDFDDVLAESWTHPDDPSAGLHSPHAFSILGIDGLHADRWHRHRYGADPALPSCALCRVVPDQADCR
jgi:hypothetical protein